MGRHTDDRERLATAAIRWSSAYIHAKLATGAESKDEGKPKPTADVGTPSVADAVERWHRLLEAQGIKRSAEH